MKIMIVDDHAAFRQVMKSVLKPLATDFVECQDGQEAVDQYAQVRPDFVLMDIAMQPLDGLRATAEIKARFPETRIAIVTQYDDAALRAEAARVGACAYVLKENLHEVPGILTGVTLETTVAKTTAAPSNNKKQTPAKQKPENKHRKASGSCKEKPDG
jgi:DNA-binding NarL/FixJ family response regulator